jgi:Flp pilus assembly protein TadD
MPLTSTSGPRSPPIGTAAAVTRQGGSTIEPQDANGGGTLPRREDVKRALAAAAVKSDSFIPSTKAVPIVTAEEGDVLQEANTSVVPDEDWIMSVQSVQSLEDAKLGLAAAGGKSSKTCAIPHSVIPFVPRLSTVRSSAVITNEDDLLEAMPDVCQTANDGPPAAVSTSMGGISKTKTNTFAGVTPDVAQAVTDAAARKDKHQHKQKEASWCEKVAGAHHNKGEFQKAIVLYRRAIELQPSWSCWSCLAACLRKSGHDPSEVANALENAVDIAPKDKKALLHVQIAETYKQAGATKSESMQLQKARDIDPKIALPATIQKLRDQGSKLTQKGDFEGAVKALRHAVSHEPRDAETHNSLGSMLLTVLKHHADRFPITGLALHQSKKHTEAIASFETALRRGKKDSSFAEGAIYANLGKHVQTRSNL